MARFDRAEERDTEYEDFLDHERLTLDRFRCPQCGLPLELIELIAACRRCEIGLSKEEWARRRVA